MAEFLSGSTNCCVILPRENVQIIPSANQVETASMSWLRPATMMSLRSDQQLPSSAIWHPSSAPRFLASSFLATLILVHLIRDRTVDNQTGSRLGLVNSPDAKIIRPHYDFTLNWPDCRSTEMTVVIWKSIFFFLLFYFFRYRRLKNAKWMMLSSKYKSSLSII